MSVLLVLLTLTLVIALHEFAHLLMARWFGIPVPAFSIGFGPILWRKTIGQTEYRISLLPVGGYVIPLSEEKPQGFTEEEWQRRKDSIRGFKRQDLYLSNQPPIRRFWVAAAGPGINLLISLVLITGAQIFSPRVEVKGPVGIVHVLPETPASAVGLLKGDQILRVLNTPVEYHSDAISMMVVGLDQGIFTMTILRDGLQKDLTIEVPKYSKFSDFGATLTVGYFNSIPTLRDRLLEGPILMWRLIESQFMAVQKLSTGDLKVSALSGPVGIVNSGSNWVSTPVTESRTWYMLGALFVMINIGVGILNLLPIPILDGGLMMFAVIEWARGKPLPQRVMETLKLTSILCLMLLFITTFVQDIMRIIFD